MSAGMSQATQISAPRSKTFNPFAPFLSLLKLLLPNKGLQEGSGSFGPGQLQLRFHKDSAGTFWMATFWMAKYITPVECPLK